MKMALPRGMVRHPKTGMLWARKDVPVELRQIIGQTSLKATLRTKDVETARVVFHDVMRSFESRIAQARKIAAGDRSTVFEPFKLDLTPEQQQIYERYWRHTPQGQMSQIAEQVETRLAQAKLIQTTREPITTAELFEKWKAERRPAENSANEFRRALDLFIEVNTDQPVNSYTNTHARDFKDRVIASRKPDGSPLAFQTQQKTFTAVKTLFGYADKNEYLDRNPFEKITLDRPKRARETERTEWDQDQLKTLFSSPIYLEWARPKGGAGEAAYWLPVLSLYHASRLGELCQLDLTDVVTRDGILCLSISTSEDDDDMAKSVKTGSSRRLVPVHKEVLKLGFREYVESVRKRSPKGKLFPAVKPDSVGRWSGRWSKWFGRYRRELGITTRYPDFHSFRHNWKTAARGAGLPEDHHDEISGHENGSVGRQYGRIPVGTLKKSVDRVTFRITVPKWTTR